VGREKKRKKEGDRGGEEVSESRKEEDKGSNHNVVKHLFEVCTSVSNMDVYFIISSFFLLNYLIYLTIFCCFVFITNLVGTKFPFI
jgi:hypothetical protein